MSQNKADDLYRNSVVDFYIQFLSLFFKLDDKNILLPFLFKGSTVNVLDTYLQYPSSTVLM